MAHAHPPNALVMALTNALGTNCFVTNDYETNRDAAKGKAWVIEELGGAVHVLHKGETLCLCDVEDLAIRYELIARGAWNETVYPMIEAQGYVEQEMWPDWEARGYAIDEACSPDNGWGENERFWRLNVVRAFESVDELVKEVLWVATQDILCELA